MIRPRSRTAPATRRGRRGWTPIAAAAFLVLCAPVSGGRGPSLPAPDAPALAEPANVLSIPQDLTVPPIADGAPRAGRRVRETTAGWESTLVHHAVYLPEDWTAEGSFPVLFEYPGNGGFRDALGDVCNGTVEGCNLGYGLSGGRDWIWVCLPFVETTRGRAANTALWWGDPSETVRYCVATVRHVCADLGGDPDRIVLCGFSRGSIACNYIGLRDETIAPLWKAFLCHSHYDGARGWSYPESDRDAARIRLRRLAGRPQFISSEGSNAATRAFLEASGVRAPFTIVDAAFANHTDAWALRDCALRRAARRWLAGLGLVAHPRDRGGDVPRQ